MLSLTEWINENPEICENTGTKQVPFDTIQIGYLMYCVEYLSEKIEEN